MLVRQASFKNLLSVESKTLKTPSNTAHMLLFSFSLLEFCSGFLTQLFLSSFYNFILVLHVYPYIWHFEISCASVWNPRYSETGAWPVSLYLSSCYASFTYIWLIFQLLQANASIEKDQQILRWTQFFHQQYFPFVPPPPTHTLISSAQLFFSPPPQSATQIS